MSERFVEKVCVKGAEIDKIFEDLGALEKSIAEELHRSSATQQSLTGALAARTGAAQGAFCADRAACTGAEPPVPGRRRAAPFAAAG